MFNFTKKLVCLVALTPLGGILYGCQAEAQNDDSAQSAAELTDEWRAVLRCGSDDVVVDGSSLQSRFFQAVVREPHAVSYLATHPGDGAVKPNSHGELIFRGYASVDANGGHGFHGFVQTGFGARDSNDPQAYAQREGNGLRIRLVSFSTGQEVERSNWFFPNCR